ncbi:MAG: hypothetical protein WA637_03365 [Terriglobales bacterium]
MTASTEFINQHLVRFAAKHNLRVQRDDCNDPVILGKLGHLYEYDSTELALMILPSGRTPRPRLWNSKRERCMAAGMTLRQNGDAEGALSFNPEDKALAKLAIRMAGARPKRQMSPERRKAQLIVLEKARQVRKNSIRKGTSEAFWGHEGQDEARTTPVVNLDRETPVSIVVPVPAAEVS